MMRKEHLKLKDAELSYLTTMTTSGKLPARQFKRAMTLLLLNEGETLATVAKTLKYCYPRVIAVRDRYRKEGLECLTEKPRTGRPVLIDGKARACITALACSAVPPGYARWSLRLLAEKAVELEYVEAISHNEVGAILKKMNSARI